MTRSEALESIRVLGLRRYLYLRFLYRHVQRAVHHFGWHHPRIMLMKDGRRQHWCEWCGLRYIEPPQSSPHRIGKGEGE